MRRWKMLAPWMLLGAAAIEALPVRAAVHLSHGHSEAPRTLRLEIGGRPVAFVQFDFEPTGLHAGTAEPEPGWLQGAAHREGAYRESAWPTAGPDRFDDFSIRWRGLWSPGEGAVSVRLRSDSTARLFLDGREALSTEGSPTGASTTLNLGDRTYELRLDYSHPTGESFVALESKVGESAWAPLVPNLPESRESPGWRGEYFLGEDFRSEAFRRIDREVFWNWGNRGPFNRLEDLPAARLRWTEEGEDFAGSFSSNRLGNLLLHLLPVPDSDLYLQFEETRLRIGESEGESIGIHFDQPGDSALRGDVLSVRFPVDSDRPLRFWRPGDELQSGEQVERRLDRALRTGEARRLRLSGALSRIDASLGPGGRWWVEMLLNRLRALVSELGEGEESGPELRFAERLNVWSEVFAPDLAPDLERLRSGWKMVPSLPPFEDADEDSVRRLIETLEGKPGEPASDESLFYPERRVDWEVLTLVEGLTRLLVDLAEFERWVEIRPEEGLGIKAPPEGRVEGVIENFPMNGLGFRFQFSETRKRFENEQGVFLEFGGPVAVTGFRLNARGEWEARVRGGTQSVFETGPSEKVSGATWDGTPLLLTSQGPGRKRGVLPAGEGLLRLIPLPVQEGTPPN